MITKFTKFIDNTTILESDDKYESTLEYIDNIKSISDINNGLIMINEFYDIYKKTEDIRILERLNHSFDNLNKKLTNKQNEF